MASLEGIEVVEGKISQITDLIEAIRASSKKELEQQISSTYKALDDTITDKTKPLETRLAEIEAVVQKLSEHSTRLDEASEKQIALINNLLGDISIARTQADKTDRLVGEIQARLDGTRNPTLREASLEAMRIQSDQSANTLAGVGGQMPYKEIQSFGQNLRFLIKLVVGLVSLVGVSGAVAATSAALGIGKGPDLAPLVEKQKSEIEILKNKLASIEAQVTRSEQLSSDQIGKLERRIDRVAIPAAK